MRLNRVQWTMLASIGWRFRVSRVSRLILRWPTVRQISVPSLPDKSTNSPTPEDGTLGWPGWNPNAEHGILRARYSWRLSFLSYRMSCMSQIHIQVAYAISHRSWSGTASKGIDQCRRLSIILAELKCLIPTRKTLKYLYPPSASKHFIICILFLINFKSLKRRNGKLREQAILKKLKQKHKYGSEIRSWAP